MAAVCSEKNDSLRANNESSSTEFEKGAVQVISIDPVSNSKAFNAVNSNEEMDSSPNGPITKAQDHYEVLAPNAIRIKVEQVDEDESVAVRVVEVGEGDLGGRATRKGDSSERGEFADGDCPFRCEDCSEAFGNKDAYLEHRSKHIHDGPIVCLDTDSQWDDLLVSTDGGQRTLFCALCGQKFSSSKGFFNHQLKHRNQALKQGVDAGFEEGTARQKVFECKDCGKAFSSIGQCLNHQRSHKQASKSVFHQLAHLKKKSFQCPTCGRCYSRASALDAHRRCHEIKLVKSRTCETTEKPPSLNAAPGQAENNENNSEQNEDHQQKFFCVCGKSFRTMCGLGTHQRFSTSCSEGKVKEESKPRFECSECGKTFVSAMALSSHQRWHKRRAELLCSGQSYKCNECGKEFTSLTFYNRHQRLAHNEELPAKSFLHQVCQLKKKAFECQECGRRFSRASALQSHQLCHTDVFRDIIKKESETSPVKTYQNEAEKVNNTAFGVTVYSQDISHTQERDLNCYETVDVEAIDVDYEVVHITAIDDCESSNGQDQNPDLELVCESDQEERDDTNLIHTAESTISPMQLSPETDVKIVQIDYEHLNDEALINDKIMESRKYNCPHCDRTFVKALSLRCHMLWHKGINKNGKQKFPLLTSAKRVPITCEVCGHESASKNAHYFHMGKHEDKVPYKSFTYQLENLQKNNIKCEECGVSFSRLSALHSHQQNHKITKKPFACLQCDKSYLTAGGLINHQKVCCGRENSVDNAKDEKPKHFNPTKSLLGPKVHHCKKCGKGFWSLGAFYHHKQNHMQCADVETRRTEASDPENSHIQRKRRGRARRRGQRKQHHMNLKEKYECEVCGKSYHFLACFIKHKLIHEANGLQPAVKSFDYQVEQLKKNSYQCPDCGKGFSRAMALQFHMKCHSFETVLPGTEPSNLPPSPEKLQCSTCQAHFSCESLLQNHQKICTNQDNKAEECEKVEIKKQDASYQKGKDVLASDTSHLTDSGKEQKTLSASNLKYKCRDCTRSFSVIGALNFHRRIHRKGYASKKLKAEPAKQLKVAKVKLEESLEKTPFTCIECGRYFSSNSALGTHRRWHKDKKFARFLSKRYKICSRKSVDGGPYLCNLCGKGFFYLCVLRRHQLHHPPMETQHQHKQGNAAQSDECFTCPDCQMSFSTGSLLTTHFANHHGKLAETDKRQSEISTTVESRPSVNKPHTSKMNSARQERPKVQYQCSYCPKSFLNVRGLRAHKWQKHLAFKGQPAPTSPEEHPKLFTCSFCELTFASEGALHNHKRSCNANKKELKASTEEEPAHHSQTMDLSTKCFYKCPKCAKDFPSEEQLNAHKEQAKSRPHCCALCCRGYWTESQLQQHLAWHDEVRRRLPTELRYRLNASMTPGSLDKLKALPYRSTSTKVKHPEPLANPQPNHKCQHCGKNFLSPCALQQHQALHKSDEPYQCSLCPRFFSDIRDLIDHHQECLGDKERRDSKLFERGAGNLTCTECGISFKQETQLHQHYIEHARGNF